MQADAVGRQTASAAGSSTSAPQASEADQRAAEAAQGILCGSCKKTLSTKMVCGRCRIVPYCNTDCQKAHWFAGHKLVCKAPERTTVTITSRTLSGEEKKVKVPHKMWEERDPAALSKPILSSRIAAGAQAATSADTLSITMQNNSDIVSFFSSYSPDQIRRLKSQSCASFTPEKLNELIQRQNYIAVLSHVWTLDDLDQRVAFLRPYAEQGHPILMLELSRTLCFKLQKTKNLPEDALQEMFKWFILGLHCTSLDASCCEDRSVGGAMGLLAASFRNCMTDEMRVALQSHTQTSSQAIVATWNPLETHPSPKWVVYHGLHALGGDISLKPETEWLALRLAKHAAALSSS